MANGNGASSTEDTEEWLIKTLKLSISAHASLFTDPPPERPSRPLPSDLASLIPPNPPHKLLETVHETCVSFYPDRIIPPPILSTLILASLKLQPTSDALECIHKITEEWLEILPDDFMRTISQRKAGHRKVEAGREGYLKIMELFTGEVLCREGEYEMARGILDGDTLLSGKRKEVSHALCPWDLTHDRPYIAIYELLRLDENKAHYHRAGYYLHLLLRSSYLMVMLRPPINLDEVQQEAKIQQDHSRIQYQLLHPRQPL